MANADGTAAAGDVKVVMKKGKKKFKSTVTLNAKGKGKAAFTKVAPGKYKLTVKYAGSDSVEEVARRRATSRSSDPTHQAPVPGTSGDGGLLHFPVTSRHLAETAMDVLAVEAAAIT